MTTIEIKGKRVPEILNELEDQAKLGNCKTCQFCVREEKADQIGKEFEYYCLIQGNLNPQWCPKEALDQFQYPMHCDDGKWHRVEDDGSITDREGCLAYSPRAVDAIPYGDALVTKHRAFMHCLAEAANLHYAIEDAHSGKAQAKLDELLRRLNTGDFSDYRLY